MATQPLTALGASTGVKQSASGNGTGARGIESSFSATLSEQRAHHQSSSTSAQNQTPDAGSDRPGDPADRQDEKHAHNPEKSKSDDKDQHQGQNAAGQSEPDRGHTQDAAGRPAADHNPAQDNETAANQVGQPVKRPHHDRPPANSNQTSNPDLDDRGNQRLRNAPHPGTEREHQPRYETVGRQTTLKVGTRPGDSTSGERVSAIHDQVNRLSGRTPLNRSHTLTDATTIKGHTESETAKGRTGLNDYLRTHLFSETIPDAKTFNDRIIQRLTTARIDVTPTVSQTAKTSDGPANTTPLIQSTPLHMMPTGSSQSIATSSSATATSGTSMTGGINAPLGSDQWQQALTKQSLRISHSGGGHARLTLHPPSLGTLHVSLQLGNQSQIHFASPHADVRAAVNSALPQLKEAFADAGIDLGQTSVWDNPQQFDTRDGDRRDQQNHGRVNDPVEESAEIDTTAMQITRIPGRTSSGGVDIFA